jgi:ABC-2 type transport system permease protein
MRIIEFLIKELLQIRRDRRMLFTLLAFPIIQLMLFGYALNADVKHLAVVVVDHDRSAESRDLIRELTATEYFDYRSLVSSEHTAEAMLTAGQADLVIVVPPQFQRKIQEGVTATIQGLVDGSNPNTGTIAASYLAAIVQERSVRVLTQRVERTGGSIRLTSAGVDARMRVWYNPALETKYSMVPGVICTVVGMMAMMLSATAIVKEREDGTIEQLIVTPVRTWELMLGKSLPILVIGFFEIITVLVAGVALFEVPVRGSVLLLMACATPFLIASIAIGLIVSTVSQTQHQASMTMQFFSMPNMLLSGFMFPIGNMPRVLQWFTYLLPMRYFLVIVRGILLKGNGIDLLWNQFVPLIVLAALFLVVATWRFRKKLD